MSGKRIIDGLKDAVAGNFSRVTIDGQTWARVDEDDVRPIRCFMDGIDWQHHLEADRDGTKLYPSIDAAKAGNSCIESGGCGVVEVEVSLVRWAEKQDLKYR